MKCTLCKGSGQLDQTSPCPKCNGSGVDKTATLEHIEKLLEELVKQKEEK